MSTLLVYLTGCTVIEYRDGESSFKRTSFGTQLQITELNATTDKKGNRKITLQGYTSDQVEALKAVAEGVAEGAMKGMKP